MRTGVIYRGVIWLGLEFDHSPPHSKKFKNNWTYTATTPILLSDVESDSYLLLVILVLTVLRDLEKT